MTNIQNNGYAFITDSPDPEIYQPPTGLPSSPETIRDTIGAALVAGANIGIAVDDDNPVGGW